MIMHGGEMTAGGTAAGTVQPPGIALDRVLVRVMHALQELGLGSGLREDFKLINDTKRKRCALPPE